MASSVFCTPAFAGKGRVAEDSLKRKMVRSWGEATADAELDIDHI
jgi:hypothetical protein